MSRLRHRDGFTTIRTEGAILPRDLLARIAALDKDLGGLTPDDYHLSGEKLGEATNRAWNRLQGAWAAFRGETATLRDGDPGTTPTREKWLLPLFQELGYGRLPTAKAHEIDGRSYAVSHGWGHVPIHLVGLNVDIGTRTPGVAGAAQASPHSLLQEFLNRSDEHLWGFVSNGLSLRILRDNRSLTRQAFVEFDLEAMMTGEAYADFALLYLLCHQSRVEAERPEECRLERWSRAAEAQGTRALEQLRTGVEATINALGTGFIAHQANTALRQKLQDGTLSTQDYYRGLLRLVYRLLFVFVAEDRGLLLDPGASTEAKALYTRFYSTARLRRLAERRRGSRHADLYRGLRMVLGRLGEDRGCPELALPALGSFLFSDEGPAALGSLEIANRDLLAAVRGLAFTTEGNVRRAIDYRNLGSEELGSVYEALLELHPEVNVPARTFGLASAGGSERKTTGSYYTPTSLIQCLLDSALDPVVADALRAPDPEAALLALRVCDPACGSGHFLVAAAHRLAKRLAAVRTGDEEPSPEAQRTALRDVIGHCLYGVDLNPMAVELCKVSLWMEALEPGKPLSFLDHRILCGNSLLGATPALLAAGVPDEAFKPLEGDDKKVVSALRKQNKLERSGWGTLFAGTLPALDTTTLAETLAGIDHLADDSPAGVHAKEERYRGLAASAEFRRAKLAADAWCAAFVCRKSPGALPAVTHDAFLRLAEDPASVPAAICDEVERLADEYRFFHWHLGFPDVFRTSSGETHTENEAAGWSGGFDVVLGNPPWERIKLQEQEFFAIRHPGIADAPNAAARRQMIDRLVEEDPPLHAAFLAARRQAEGESHLIRNSGRYPLCGRGDVNTYTIFAETKRTLLGPTGRVGTIVPSGIATDDTTKFFFQDLMDGGSLVSLYDFENARPIFPGVHRSYKFCLLTLTGAAAPATRGADFTFFCHDTDDLRDPERRFTLSAEDIALLNPNTRTCPVFRTRRDAEITKGIYRRVPVLVREGPPEENPWGVSFLRMFDMSNDSHLFRTRAELAAEGWRLEGNVFVGEEKRYLRLYEGRLGHQFDHRFATQPNGEMCEVTDAEHSDPTYAVETQYWVPEVEANRRVARRGPSCTSGLLGFRRVARSTDERTSIACILPWGAASYGWILTMGPTAKELLLLLTLYNSFALDYLLRNALSQPSVPQGTFAQLACPDPDAMNGLADFVVPRALELTYTSLDLKEFAQDCGFSGLPFVWDEERRFQLRCELDALVFKLYAIGREDVEYIMETFSIVRRKDELLFGEYRTKNAVLMQHDLLSGLAQGPV